MCYEYSGWFEKIRAKQLRKTQENIDALNKRVTPAPAAKTEPAKPVEERAEFPEAEDREVLERFHRVRAKIGTGFPAFKDEGIGKDILTTASGPERPTARRDGHGFCRG